MSNSKDIDQNKRQAILKRISDKAVGISYSLSMSKITQAKLKELTLNEADKSKGDKALSQHQESIEKIALYISEDKGNSEVLANHVAAELVDFRNNTSEVNPAYNGISLTENGISPELDILDKASVRVRDSSIFALVKNDKSQWLKGVTSKLSHGLYDFLRDKGELSGLDAIGLLIQAKKGLDFHSKHFDVASVQKGLPNLGAKKAYEELSVLLSASKDNDKSLAFPLFCVVGKDVAANLYDIAVKTNNTDYAMSLLAGNKHSFLKEGGEHVSSDPQIRNLISIVSKGDEANTNLAKLANLDIDEDAKTNLLTSIIKVHNRIYSKTNISNMLDNMEGKMSQKQLSKIALVLGDNYNKQPILPALDSLISKAKQNELSDTQLIKMRREVEVKLQDEVGALDRTAISYSTVRFDFPDSNQTMPLSSIRSIEHLERVLMESGIANLDNMKMIGSNSYLDNTVKLAVSEFIYNDDDGELKTLFDKKVKDLDLDLEKKSQLLFDANKQQAEIVTNHDSDKFKLLSEVSKSDDFIYNKGQPIAKLTDMKSADDFLNAVKGLYDYDITIDDLGLGAEFKVEFERLLEDTANSKDNFNFVNKLDTTLRLPVSYLSSKMEETQIKTIEQHQIANDTQANAKNEDKADSMTNKAVEAIKNTVRFRR